MMTLRSTSLLLAALLLLPASAFAQDQFLGDYELEGRYSNRRGTAVDLTVTKTGDNLSVTRWAIWTARRYKDMDPIVWVSTETEVRGNYLIVTYALQSELEDASAGMLDGLDPDAGRDDVLAALAPEKNVFRAAYSVKSDGEAREYVLNQTRLGDDAWWRYIVTNGVLLDAPGDDVDEPEEPVLPEEPVPSADLPADWAAVLKDEMAKPYFAELQAYVAQERQQHQVFPSAENVYSAFHFTPYQNVKVVILGQDPYHDVNQAHGLSFSVLEGEAPPSLANMFKEYNSDLGHDIPDTANLTPWAKQGVLLLNAVLTVRAHQAHSHKNQGWEEFTDEVIRSINRKDDRVVFVLWGGAARAKKSMIDTSKHTVIESHHPSPLSSWRTGPLGFFGSKFYSRTNAALEAAGREPIDWKLD